MNTQQNRTGPSTRKKAEKQDTNRFWFTLLTIGGILLILLVAYRGKSLGLGEIGVVGVWVVARILANHADARARPF